MVWTALPILNNNVPKDKMDYNEFIESKIILNNDYGFDINQKYLNKSLFDYQKEIVTRACKKGRYALFVDTGLGKSIMQLNFGYAVNKQLNKNVLFLAPLVVAYQMVKEAKKFGYKLNHIHKINGHKDGLNITNYDNLKNIDTSLYDCVILDESSILKNASGKLRIMITELFFNTSYKLLCTATPSPNDFMELGTHSEMLNDLKVEEMKMMYFTQDRGNVQNYVLKGHAVDSFWEWVSCWAECISNPSDLGYDGSKHILPKLNENFIEVEYDDCDYTLSSESLFSFTETNATTISKNKNKTIELRIEVLKTLLKEDEQHLIWIDTNDEADLIKKSIDGIVEVRGSDTEEIKAKRLMDFADGKIKWLMTKSSIAGMGMNFQNANNMTFIGLNYSYEKYYQAVRRMYRFGQTKQVNVNVIVADNEIQILQNMMRKKDQHIEMKKYMLQSVQSVRTKKQLKSNANKIFTFPKFLKSK